MLWFQRINLLSLCLCFVVIVLGAYVRLSDAGLGCPDWPGCYGHIGVPQADHEIAAAEARFPERPVEVHKAWKEMVHRYAASTLGLLIVAMAVMSRRIENLPKRLPWFLVALVVFQGILGMWTVTWQLKPMVVTAHLLGGMSTFALLLWQWLSARRAAALAADAATAGMKELRSERHIALALAQQPDHGTSESTPVAPPRLRLYAGLALALVVMQIFLGGWTSTNYAALACPDLPTCHGSYWPETDVKTAFTLWHGLGINYEYGILDARARVTIHHFHRVGAVIVTVALLLLGAWLWRRPVEPLWRRFSIAVTAALVLQVTIGLSIVKLQLPLGLATAHNAGAAILLSVLVVLNHAAWTRRAVA
jgi:cytochrome c oxidase assembly protein subunit 15